MSDWRDLFEPVPAGVAAREMALRLVRRHGHDLLVLPASGALAAQAMALYPAQTWPARVGKALLRLALASRAPVPLPKAGLRLAGNDALIGWAAELAGAEDAGAFSILAGNPGAPGRRFVVLVFRGNRPAVVLKAGIEPDSCALIDREAAFLRDHAGIYAHLPRLRGTKKTERWQGLALAYLDGGPPRPEATAGMREVLSAWLDSARSVPLETLAPWQRLIALPGAAAGAGRLSSSKVTPALFHGDFAPWNVRESPVNGAWTALDWERGEAVGVPGWDWFHWLIHVSVLVRHHDPAKSVRFLSEALGHPDFAAYAQAAQIVGLEKSLLASYVVYLHEFIAPPSIKTILGRLRDATAEWR